VLLSLGQAEAVEEAGGADEEVGRADEDEVEGAGEGEELAED
jgi:hypothetical protein